MFARVQPVLRYFTVPRLFQRSYQQTQVASFANAYGNKKKFATNNKFSAKSSVDAAVASIRINEQIRYPSMRVIFPNVESGDMEWKILSRADALKMAQDRSLDLILVNDKAEPPVCKLERYGNKVKDIKTKEKELRLKEKTREQKEMFMTGGIEDRDFQTKMNKVDSFLRKGHTVKITIVPKRFTKNNRFKDGVRRDRMGGFDDTILLLLEFLEKHPVVVAEQKVRAPPPPTTMMVKGKKVNIPVPGKEKVKEPKESTGIVRNTSEGEDEEELTSEPPPVDDNESDSEDEEEARMMSGGGQVGHNGQRLILRREFLVTPKSEMLTKAVEKK